MARRKGTSLLGVKELNRLQIRRVIYHRAPVTRQMVADELGLTLPTITTNVADMLAEGLLIEYESPANVGSPQGGRPAQLLDFKANAQFAIGLELGPYQTLFCITDLRGKVQCKRELPLVPQGYEEMLDFLSAQAIALIEESGIASAKILGAGIGLPGYIDSETGVIRTGLYASWSGKSFMDDLSVRIGLPVWIDNNVRMRAVGREMFAENSAPDTFAYLYVSKGIACPLMIKNDMLAGHKASAGEIGHTTVLPDGPVCPVCGRRGCLGAVSGERAILDAARAALIKGEAPQLAGLLRSGEHLAIRHILEAQAMNDPSVCAILDRAVGYLGVTVANIFNFISPSLVVVDGYIFNNEENRRRLQETAYKNLYGLAAEEAKIEFVPYDLFTGACGAAAFAVRRKLLE